MKQAFLIAISFLFAASINAAEILSPSCDQVNLVGKYSKTYDDGGSDVYYYEVMKAQGKTYSITETNNFNDEVYVSKVKLSSQESGCALIWLSEDSQVGEDDEVSYIYKISRGDIYLGGFVASDGVYMTWKRN